jgi:hypothetical protein
LSVALYSKEDKVPESGWETPTLLELIPGTLTGPTECLILLPGNGKRSSFRNIVFLGVLQNIRRRTKSKKLINPDVRVISVSCDCYDCSLLLYCLKSSKYVNSFDFILQIEFRKSSERYPWSVNDVVIRSDCIRRISVRSPMEKGTRNYVEGS